MTKPAPKLQDSRIDWRQVLERDGPWSGLVTPGSSPDRVSRYDGGRLVYLAAPYARASLVRGQWHYDRSLRASLRATVEVARLASCGVTAICPSVQIAEIAHGRGFVDEVPEVTERSFWVQWSMPMLAAAGLVVVPEIEGWRECPTIWSAVVVALLHNVPVHVYAGAA